jgi:outer membrane protein assembly factor BamB
VVTRVLGKVVVVDPAIDDGIVLGAVGFGSELVVAGDSVVVNDSGGQVVVIDPSEGTELMRIEHPDGISGVDVQALWSDGERIVVGYDGEAAVFDLAGQELYRVATGPAEIVDVVVDGDFLAVSSEGDVTEVALFEMPATEASGYVAESSLVALLSGGRTLVRDEPTGTLVLGTLTDKKLLWRLDDGRWWLPHPLVIGETAWVTAEDDSLHVLDIAAGTARMVSTPGPTRRAPVLSDAGVVVVTDDGIVVVLDPDTGQPVTEPLQLPAMDEVNGFAVDGSTLYVTAQQTAPDLERDARVVLWGIDLNAL